EVLLPQVLLGSWLGPHRPTRTALRDLVFGQLSDEPYAVAFPLPRLLDKESLDWLRNELPTRLNAIGPGELEDSREKLVGVSAWIVDREWDWFLEQDSDTNGPFSEERIGTFLQDARSAARSMRHHIRAYGSAYGGVNANRRSVWGVTDAGLTVAAEP